MLQHRAEKNKNPTLSSFAGHDLQHKTEGRQELAGWPDEERCAQGQFVTARPDHAGPTQNGQQLLVVKVTEDCYNLFPVLRVSSASPFFPLSW